MMATTTAHWTETIMKMAADDLNRAAAAMQGHMLKPEHRAPNVRPQIIDAIANPQAVQAYPADARARLVSMLYQKYGEQARNIAPYLGLDVQDNSQVVPNQTIQ